MANIAEGFERGGDREFIQFLSNSKGSCGEVKSHLYVALDQRYVTPPGSISFTPRPTKSAGWLPASWLTCNNHRSAATSSNGDT